MSQFTIVIHEEPSGGFWGEAPSKLLLACWT